MDMLSAIDLVLAKSSLEMVVRGSSVGFNLVGRPNETATSTQATPLFCLDGFQFARLPQMAYGKVSDRCISRPARQPSGA